MTKRLAAALAIAVSSCVPSHGAYDAHGGAALSPTDDPGTLGWPLVPATTKQASLDDMVAVPSGPFTRGFDVPPLNRDEYPRSKVQIDAFYIDRTEVTVAAYTLCVHDGVCDSKSTSVEVSSMRTRPSAECNFPHPDRALHPMNCVSWADAYRYCAWAGKRLPTEAEWEKAARGSEDERQAPWGDLGTLVADGGVPRANLADETFGRAQPKLEWFHGLDDGYVATAPVGSFPAGKSPYGALDMLGNVAEWVFDWYNEDEYFRGAAANPHGLENGALRVYRGHSWSAVPSVVRITRRSAARPGDRDPTIGFRCALDNRTATSTK